MHKRLPLSEVRDHGDGAQIQIKDTDGGVSLEAAIEVARLALLKMQHPDGHWCFELEADCTIPSEYILMMHYMDEIDSSLQSKLAAYLRAHQASHGGWPLYSGGTFNISCSVKAYYALKLAGNSPGEPHMVRAREAILAAGGAARANVFTRITLAFFRQIPWCGVPFMPIEIMLFPRWFPFHLDKVSYWSRTVMVPLLILCNSRARAKNPRNIDIRELFVIPPEKERHYFESRSRINRIFLLLDKIGRACDPLFPRWVRRRAFRRAEEWFIERLNGEDGLGAIFPAMVNAYEALASLGYGPDHPYCVQSRTALKKLLIVGETSAYCQPCMSPVWDTALAVMALQETDGCLSEPAIQALDWLRDRQISNAVGDWQRARPEVPAGGWAFQYSNPYYPDLDDTSVIAWAMDRAGAPARYGTCIARAAAWLCGMQCRNGGFASFDVDNTHYYLNEIPFADHGALLDPPTSDVSAHVLSFLSRLKQPAVRPAVEKCLAFLRSEQEEEGAWFGRWGTNYIYGTSSVLLALEQAGIDADQAWIRKAVTWLKRTQRLDGGWGEDNHTYFEPSCAGQGFASTSFQTAWALLGLMAAGQGASKSVQGGVDYLLRTQGPDGVWRDAAFTAPGFPRVFYLKYHGYSIYFPLWALARYRRLNGCLVH